MPIKYVGRITDFKGKTLWEIVGNLKNFGVGRIVARSMFERYPEPSYMKIMKVETLPNEEVRKVKVWVEKTFRGRTLPKLVEVCSASYKADYKLIPKEDEASYCRCEKPHNSVKILPRTCEFPPLLKELITRDKYSKGETIKQEDLVYSLKYRIGRENNVRLANEGEKSNVEIVSGLGTPASPALYKDIKL